MQNLMYNTQASNYQLYNEWMALTEEAMEKKEQGLPYKDIEG